MHSTEHGETGTTPAHGQQHGQRRPLSSGYPDLARLAKKPMGARHGPDDEALIAGLGRQLDYLGRISELEGGRVLVVGCGPQPRIVSFLVERGYDAIGLEPIPAFVDSARLYVGAPERVVQGTCEHVPLEDDSVHLVYANAVMEHVDSVGDSLREMYRVLRPGGMAFIITTNRLRVSLTGDNGEYTIPFFNWFPPIVKECLVYKHLHHDPSLANYSERPAVHWFTFDELCARGREAGFGQFYTPLDAMEPGDAPVQKSALKRLVASAFQKSALVRAGLLTFTALGGMIVMVKRA